MTHDFDKLIDRRGTNSLKWDLYKGRDVIPMWVADMDFRVSTAIIEALRAHVDHGVFGYTLVPDELTDVVIERLATQYRWKIERDWIVWLPGLVTGINVACRAVGNAGDEVLTMVPIYPPFLTAPGNFSRGLIKVPLMEGGEGWEIDFDLLERSVTPSTRLLLLCNPHNPTGRVFTSDELSKLAQICERHDLVICSDEIHCELVLDRDKNHIPTAALSPDVEKRTITLMAPSKTFNIPGLGCSFAVISDEPLRKQFLQAMKGIVPHVNALGYTAALAAYRDSRDWHVAMIDYLAKNRDIVERAVETMPGLSMHHVEATYLAWIDTRQTGMDNPVRTFEEAGVGLSDGKPFEGEGFVRLNFGCPRSVLDEALARMRKAFCL
ncbi:MAG TPA: PatB family C-S lyase [Syntrophales bacterium]|nr:PatB family C-S lyase [Geobacteraceae bacterium]HPQ43817.1 PatB family C-S lyase [Syntrophales bacterium]